MKACVQTLTLSSVLRKLAMFAMFTLTYSINLQRQGDGQTEDGPPPLSKDGSGDFQLELYPPQIDKLLLHTQRDVHINCSMLSSASPPLVPTIPESQNTSEQNLSLVFDLGEEYSYDEYLNLTYIAIITSKNPTVAIVTGPEDQVQNVDNRTDEIMLEISPFVEAIFTVKARNIGRALMMIRIQSYYSTYGDYDNGSAPTVRALSAVEYRVTVIRQLRTVDLVFDCVIATMAGLNSFSMGCLTDWPSLRHHLHHPTALLIGLVCQLLVMPTVALGLSRLLPPEEGLGLFYVACVPAGGAGHIVVSIINGDRALSISLNFFGTVIAAASAPLWVFGLGRFLGLTDHLLKLLYDFELWLGGSVVCYILGILLNYFNSGVADGFLNWVIKPWLLLFTIVFSTIGMYINLYMFAFINPITPIAAGLLPLIGYLIGLVTALLARQDVDYVRTIGTEAAFSNCMLVLAMVRFSLPHPEADLLAKLPMWVISLMPIPFLLTFMVQSIRRFFVEQCDRQREKKYRNFSIVSSLLNVTNVTTLSSSLTPKMNSPNDDSTMLIDEKVTVL